MRGSRAARNAWRALRARRTRRASRPLLSVVVPVYDVEAYLPATLDSLLAQTLREIEVVVVIDGATDRSGEIARQYAARDPRLIVLEQHNAGLGAARNVGTAAARGEYLTFADADDLVPPGAYATMMETIRRTGSDMVVGTLKRDNGRRQWAMRLMQVNHRVRRERVTLREAPLMLADVFAVNKVYRRSFWDAAGLSFPVGIRYEDQPVLTRAFLASTAFDVIPETVYLWRVREDRSSITQGRHHLADLEDRISTKLTSTALVLAADQPEVLDTWFRDVLPVDMWEYFRSVPGCSPEYWSTLRAGLQQLWHPGTVGFEATRVPAQQRLMGWLVDQGRREELEELVAFVDFHRGDVPIELRDDHVVALLPGVEDRAAGLPESVYVLGPHEHRWEGRVTVGEWDEGLLRLEGFALIANAPPGSADTSLTGHLVRDDQGRDQHPLDLEVRTEPRATRHVGRPRQDYDDCGFRTSVDVAALLRSSTGATTWRIELQRRVAGLVGAGGLSALPGTHQDRTWHEVVGDGGRPGRVRLHTVGGQLVVEVRPG